MKEEPFEKSDESWMNQFKALREKKIPSQALEGFSASVEEKIQGEFKKKAFRANPAKLWAPVWVPVLALFLVFFGWLASGRFPLGGGGTPAVPMISFPWALATTSEISEEVALLRELGVWTEEDDESLNF